MTHFFFSTSADRRLQRSSSRGFTLIEVLISLSIFLILLGVLMTSFFQLYKNQREANEVRAVIADMRTLVNFVQDELRTKTVDFCGYESGDECKLSSSQSKDTLVLVNKERTEQTIISFKIENVGAEDRGRITFQRRKKDSPEKGWYAMPGYDTEKDISMSRLQFKSVKFSLAPMGDANVYLSSAAYQMQPSVTMHISFGNNYYLQTSFSSRVY